METPTLGHKTLKNKRGQSLVEVVVSLTILMIVLVSTITLITTVMNLTMSARMKTEAVSLAQKAIADASSSLDFGNTCLLTAGEELITRDITSRIYPSSYNDSDQHNGIKIALNTSELSGPEQASLGIGLAGNLMKLTATASWTYKGLSDEVVITQIVNRP